MQRWWVAFTALLLAVCTFARAQTPPPSSHLLIEGNSAYTWSDTRHDILQVTGDVTIRLDSMTLSADGAVIWLSTSGAGGASEQQQAEIALVGHAKVLMPSLGMTRSGDHLYVTSAVQGEIRITADQRLAVDQSQSALFQQAQQIRDSHPESLASSAATAPTAGEGGAVPEETRAEPVLAPTTQESGTAALPGIPSPSLGAEATEEALSQGQIILAGKRSPVHFHATDAYTITTPDDTLAIELEGNVILVQTRENKDFIEMRSHRAVLFSTQKASGIHPASDNGDISSTITGAYLEGDVQIAFTPAATNKAEQRMTAARVFYDFVHDRAVLTDAILFSRDPQTQIPITVRAQRLRQLSLGEYEGRQVQVSTSSFPDASIAVRTDRIYMHQEQVPVPYDQGATETDTVFVAYDDTLNIAGLPVFYLPVASGSINNDPFPLRRLSINNSQRFGFGVESEYGLFELAGQPRPKNLDLTMDADFYSERGPGIGFNGRYSGANIDADSKDITDFAGDFESFLITDHGTDRFYDNRSNVDPPDQMRGKFLFEHEQFFPDNWEAQVRLGYVSDATFLEQYYPDEFFEDRQYDGELYVKHQVDTEALTFGLNFDTTRFVTSVDQTQEQFDVEHFPEIAYRREGDSFAQDTFTFFSSNTFDRLRFARSHASLADQGYIFVNSPGSGFGPGLPSEGFTEENPFTHTPTDPTSPTYRGDTLQEVDYPVQLGQIKMVPYVMGRATAYSNSPSNDAQGRLYAGTGVRFTTAFWHVYDDVESELLDLHRVRHVIEPEINLYTSAETVDRTKLFIYDEDIDAINDISAIDVTLHQRWQTQRGGPGREHSVDFLSLDVSADMYANPPKDPGIDPIKFRGIYFPSDPESSIPRDSINSNLTWLISDTTAFLADAEYNTDHEELATGSVGFAVKRDPRLSYYAGLRYIEQLNSDVATFAAQYEISSKYSVLFSQSFDFGESKDVGTSFTIQRDFDKLIAQFTIYTDSITGQSGISFNIFPEGLSPGGGDVQSIFTRQ